MPGGRRKKISDDYSHDVDLSERIKRLLLRAHKTRTSARIQIHISSHAHTPTDTHSYIQNDNKPYTKYIRDHIYI